MPPRLCRARHPSNAARIVFSALGSRLGAELVSLARRNDRGEWIGFLHRDGDLTKPESGWANHATVMGYFLHRLKDGHSLYRGQPIEGGTIASAPRTLHPPTTL